MRGQWLQLQGAGGLFGNAILSAYDHLSPVRQPLVRDRLLARVRAEVDRTGSVRRWTDHEDHRQRIRAVACSAAGVIERGEFRPSFSDRVWLGRSYAGRLEKHAAGPGFADAYPFLWQWRLTDAGCAAMADAA